MLQYATTIAQWVGKGHSAFLDPESGSRATIERQFEQFEEAANALGVSFRKANSGVPWEPIFELRDDLSHPYQQAYNPERLWRFVRDDFPRIVRHVRRAKLPSDAKAQDPRE